MDIASHPCDPRETPTVKSAHRVLEVLEYFAQGAGKATVMQIAKDLAYPQSSTSVLLSSLAHLGYLRFEASDRTYAPTVRVMLLGAWLQDQLFGHGSLVSEMERLRERTGQTVMIGLRQGVHVRFILSLHGKHPQSLRYPVGVLRPVCRSPAGRILLSHLPDAEVSRLARMANAQAEHDRDRVVSDELAADLGRIRARGWALAVDYPEPHRASLAMALPPMAGQPALALALGARKPTMQAHCERFLAEMHDACARLADSRTTVEPVESGVALPSLHPAQAGAHHSHAAA